MPSSKAVGKKLQDSSRLAWNKSLTPAEDNPSLKSRTGSFMADNNPNPPLGGVPPKPAEAAKVQPKKETVRISLPPKPTATIKLPTLPAAAPTPSSPSPAGVVAPPPSS